MRKQNQSTFLKIYLITAFIFSVSFLFFAGIKQAEAVDCVTSGDNVTIAANCSLYSGNTYTYTGTLTINPGITVTVMYNEATPTYSSITAPNIIINGTLSANSQGYRSDEGPGAGVDSGGGGYGGAGGGSVGGSTYGSITAPTDFGSGGTGAPGGGAIKLVGGNITIAGTITANGGSIAANGAGAGGSIWVVATSTLSGAGVIRANGGNTAAGAGGGGRVYIQTGTNGYTGTATADAGTGVNPQAQIGTVAVTPTLGSLSPSSVAIGTVSQVLTVYGFGFESMASIRVNGVERETSYASSLELSTNLMDSDMTAAGTLEITVINPTGSGVSNAKTFSVNNPTPVLDGMIPSTKYVGDGLAIELSGSNFVSGSKVYLDDALRTSAYSGPTLINLTLNSQDIAGTGTHLIKVVNPAPGGGTSTAATLTVSTRNTSGGGGSGAGSASPDASPTAETLNVPSAGYGKALSTNSIRWYFSSSLNNITGFRVEDASTGLTVASSTDVSVRYLDEIGLTASSTYCNRQIRAVKDDGLTPAQSNSLFPCATTKKLEMATSTQFLVSPINIVDLGIEELSFGWTASSSESGSKKLFGFYIPGLNLWVVPTSTIAATSTGATAPQGEQIEYLLGTGAYFQNIKGWGQKFKLKGLESETSYKFWIVDSERGRGVWEFTATTTPGEIIFIGGMELVSTSTQSIPVSSPLSALGGAAGKAIPSFGSLAFVGMLAFVIQHRKRGLRSCARGLCKVATSVEPKESLRVVTSKKYVRKVTGYHKGLHHATMAAFWLFCAAALVKTAVVAVGVMADPLTAYGAGADQVTVMTYELKFKNTGTKTAKNVNVVDPIPTGTIYYPGSLQVDGVSQTDAQDDDNAWYSASPSQVHFHWDSVAPGQSHALRFGVYPQSGVNQEQVNNSAFIPPPDNADPNSLNFYIHEQSICGNDKIEIVRDAQGNPVMSNSKVLWEACDDGTNNGKGYGWCKADCTGIDLPPANLCGNGKIDSWVNLKTGQTYKEICDDGANNGKPGHCNASCNGTVPLPPPPKKEEPKEVKVPVSSEQQQTPPAPSGSATATTPVAPTSTAPVREATSTVIVLPQATTTAAAPVIPSTFETVTQNITNGVNRASEVLANPTVQEATIPTIGLLAAVNVASSAGWVTLFNYLYYVFTQPIMLFSRRKREKYGVVYNSLTKLPVDLAAVRLKDANGHIIQTKVTDRQGRYTFLANKGQYTLDISKAGYNFPSSLLTGKYMDVDYVDLLTTNKISLSSPAPVSNNIPIDPKEDKRLPGQIKRKAILRDLQGTVAGLTTLLSVGAVILVPSYQYIGLALFQLVTYLVFRRLAYRKPKSYGTIRDHKTGKPVPNAVIRILDARFNRVLETQVTDAQGRYAFLVGKGKFYLMVVKKGYGTAKSVVLDYSGGSGSMVVDKDLKLAAAK